LIQDGIRTLVKCISDGINLAVRLMPCGWGDAVEAGIARLKIVNEPEKIAAKLPKVMLKTDRKSV
jgi:hypothetical protein